MNVHWQSFADFLAMGGYALYVWGSFGLTLAVLIAEPLLVLRRRAQLLRRLRRQARAEAGNLAPRSLET